MISAATQAGLYYSRKRNRAAVAQGNSPVAFWSLESVSNFDFTAETVKDQQGNFPGSLTGITSGNISGNGLSLTGSNYVTTSLTWPRNGAVGMWVFPTTYADWQSPGGWKNSDESAYALFDNSGSGSPGFWRWVFKPTGGTETDIVSAVAITENVWQYLLAGWAEVAPNVWNTWLFVNSTLIGSADHAGVAGDLQTFTFGNAGVTLDNGFPGKIDAVRVYDAIPDIGARAVLMGTRA